jgi:hypothetical protein
MLEAIEAGIKPECSIHYTRVDNIISKIVMSQAISGQAILNLWFLML